MAWVRVRDLGAISRCEIPFRCRRDRAEIAYLNPGHPEALQAGGGRRAFPGDIHNARDCWVATISARMAASGAREFQAVLWLVRARAPSKPCRPHAPNTAILAEIVATQQSRALWISPGNALRPPPACNASGWPRCRYAISAPSQGARFNFDAGEIAPRLRTCTQAIQRRYKLAEGAENTSEISTTPGIATRRRTEREHE